MARRLRALEAKLDTLITINLHRSFKFVAAHLAVHRSAAAHLCTGAASW
jgi:hypothetical protein